jgi:hypothetical protein
MLKRVPLPRKVPKERKRASRWRSPAHCNHVRAHACSIEGCAGRPIEVAHVRLGSGAGVGQKPDDWRGVSLCQEHHTRQHNIGEVTFWRGLDVEALIADFIRTSPKAAEINAIMRERGNG